MKVKELIIDGFKSYSTRTVITQWDPQFNAITGLNGSGKSNILDAICFVLGITSTTSLRAQNLLDLIYKKGQAGITKASVTITFDNTDKSASPVQYRDKDAIMISRQVSINAGQPISKYSINGTRSTQKDVSLLLQSVQLNINNPNFLIMQGQITKMLNMKPKQVLNLIEEATGTKSYEMQREHAKKHIKKKELKLDAAVLTLETQVKPELKKLEIQKGIVLEYNNTKLQMENDLSVIQAYEYQEALEKISTIDAPLKITEERYNENVKLIETYENQINALNDQIKEISSQKSAIDSNAIKKLEQEAQKIADQITKLNISKEFKQTNVTEFSNELKSATSELKSLQNGDNSRSGALREFELEFKKEQEKLNDFKEAFQRKEDLHSTLSTGFSVSGNKDAGYAAQLRDLTKRHADNKAQTERDQMQINHLKSQFDKSKLSNANNDLETIRKTISKKRTNVEQLESQLRASGFDGVEFQALKDQERQLMDDLNRKSESLRNLKRQDHRFDFNYRKPYDQFNDEAVRGFCGELFELSADKAKVQLALEVIGGGKLFNIVVDNDKVSTELLERGALQRRTTFIPLNKITSRVINSNTVNMAKKLAPNKVELALDLIEYTGDVKKAMEYTFGNKLICDDAETAKMITFDPQIRTGSVTLEGDNYDPEGRLSGGSRRNTSSLILKFRQYRDMRITVDNIKNQLNQVQRKLNNMKKVAEANSGTQDLLRKDQYEIEALERRLETSTSAVFIKRYEQSLMDIAKLEKGVESNNEKVSQLSVEISKIEKDMSEFSNNGAGKIKELEQELAKLKKELKDKENGISVMRNKFNTLQVEVDNTKSDIEQLIKRIGELEVEIPEIKNDLIKLTEEITAVEITHQETIEQIEEERERDDDIRNEIEDLKSHLHKTKAKLEQSKKTTSDSFEEMKSLQSQLKHYKKVISESIETVKNDQRREAIIEQNRNVNIDELNARIDSYDSKIRELESRGAKQDIISKIDDLNSQINLLTTRINTVSKDKKKIEDTVLKLDEKKTQELEKTYKTVSKDFGEIFNVLLDGSSAKLVKVNDNDILAGLEVRVRLGNVWKESLVELSGGQRSLVALALIMSLLQFKPAPMYILDEVDAALDLSHTQSIGHLIKTRFKNSQFIVVSLKEGMFTNANRLFRVRFQEGTSVVTAS